MGTLTSLMGLAQQALMANQAALNVISNNVANQNTPGYTRQVVNLQQNDSVTIGNLIIGGGVSGGQGISQRDRVLEQRVQQQTQVQAQSQALTDALTQVQNIFGLTSTSSSASSTQLGSALDSFFNAVSSLTANPADTPTRQKVISAAQSLVSAFNSASNQMSAMLPSLNQKVTGDVSSINGLVSTIASLNQKIASTSPNGDAGTLEDQRQQAIAQLSQYVGLNQITNENNQITLTTTNGVVLVSGGQANALNTAQVAGVAHVMAGTPPSDITAGLTGGDLGGVLQARDQMIPQYLSALDQLAYQIGTQVNQINQQGLNANGSPGQKIFQIPSSASGAASQIKMATTDPNAIAAAATGEGATGSSNAQLLAGLATGTSFSGTSPSGSLTNLLGKIGSDASAASTNNTAQQATLSQLTSQRNSLSGVSLDEEAANLTKYQRAYQAASKVFSIVDQLMSSALNLGVPSSFS